MRLSNSIETIEEFFDNIIRYPNSCCEIRIFNATLDRSGSIVRNENKDYSTTVAGWFTRADELSSELEKIDSCSAYITVNPVSLKNRPARAKNTLQVLKRGEFATNEDIILIRYLIIDIDPPSKATTSRKVNSTNSELADCIETRDSIVEGTELADHCLVGISGNGAFILVSLPDYNPDVGGKWTKKLTIDISNRFQNNKCKIDINTRHALSMLSIPGTWKFRDRISTAERPHRIVEIHHPRRTDDSPSAVRC